MSVNINDDDVFSCVALFYEKGRSGNSFLRKEKFWPQRPRKSVRETGKFMQHWLNWGRKEYMFQYLLSTDVLDFIGFYRISR